MKANIIQSTTGIQATMENGTIYSATEGQTMKAFKKFVEEQVEINFGEKVSFKNFKMQDLGTETLVIRLKSAEGVELQAIKEELATREDYEPTDADLETTEEATESFDREAIESNEPEAITTESNETENGASDKSKELTPLQTAKANLNAAEAALLKAQTEVKEKMEAAKAEVADAYNKAKAEYELAKIDTEQAVEDAEKAYKEARRVVAVTNMKADPIAKSDEQKAADIANITTTKEALEQIKKDAKETVDATKAALDAAKKELSTKVEEAKTTLMEELATAKANVEIAKKAYTEISEATKNEAAAIIEEAAARLEKVEQDIKEATIALEALKAEKENIKASLANAKGSLKVSAKTGKVYDPKTTLAEAEAAQEAAKANIGKVVYFCPDKSEEPIKGTIKATTIDKRVNLCYYRIIGLVDGKLYHVRTNRLDVPAVEVVEA